MPPDLPIPSSVGTRNFKSPLPVVASVPSKVWPNPSFHAGLAEAEHGFWDFPDGAAEWGLEVEHGFWDLPDGAAKWGLVKVNLDNRGRVKL